MNGFKRKGFSWFLKPGLRFLLVILILGASGPIIYPCGPNFPHWLLSRPDYAALLAPQAVFDLELERMQLIKTTRRAQISQGFAKDTLAIELADLRLALDRVKTPPHVRDEIVSRHRSEREKISLFQAPVAKPDWSNGAQENYRLHPDPTNNTRILEVALPRCIPGLPKEFADYFRGSVAWHQGDMSNARRHWSELLKLPAAQRYFKSTWAAYMLGRSWESENRDKAISHFRETRELADAGFSDSLGLSVASLGWEARLHWREGRFTKATDLYLEQAAAGDPTARASLRFVASAALENGMRVLEMMARHPRAQRVVTAYVIAGGYRHPAIDVDGWWKERSLQAWELAKVKFPSLPAPAAGSHTKQRPVILWLEAVEKAGVRDVQSAEQLALAAYQAGDMTICRRWLERASSTPVTQWLKAKLLLRDGKVDQAARLLALVCRQFPVDEGKSEKSTDGRFAESLIYPAGYDHSPNMEEQARGELGLVHLARRQFTEALDSLLHSSEAYWMDAAYVAERVLTLEELRVYVDRHWPSGDNSLPADFRINHAEVERPDQVTEQIRYLLARRLVRSDLLDDARPYFPSKWLTEYQNLRAAKQRSKDAQRNQSERARALFETAEMTRRYGLELLGTEVEPDWAIHGGNFTAGVAVGDRSLFQTNVLAASAEELQRARQHGVEPDRRWHYCYVAAKLGWEAARLMPDNSDETARMLCQAGGWIKDVDPQEADMFYKALVRRCRQTKIGAEADRLRWFPALDGSGELISSSVINN